MWIKVVRPIRMTAPGIPVADVGTGSADPIRPPSSGQYSRYRRGHGFPGPRVQAAQAVPVRADLHYGAAFDRPGKRLGEARRRTHH